MSEERKPAEVFHPSEYLLDELTARGWDLDELAHGMTPDGSDYAKRFAVNRLSIEMYMELDPQDSRLHLGQESAEGLERAFGIDAAFWLRLEDVWREHVT